jgi:hypothetical protein
MTERRKYKPGDNFRCGTYEVVAVDDRDNNGGCERCIGRLHTDVCDELPGGCNDDEIVWRPLNDTACLLAVTIKLEGKNLYD